MGWQIRFNNFGSDIEGNGASDDWTCIKIDRYDVAPVYGDDGITHETTHHVISGTAILAKNKPEGPDGFGYLLRKARDVLTQQCKSLHIRIRDGGTGTVDEIIEFAGDAEGFASDETLVSPKCQFTVNEVGGVRSAVVGFTIEWNQRLTQFVVTDDLSQTHHVLAHSWTSSFDVGAEDGNMTWSVQGYLRVRADTPFEATYGQDAVNRGPHPDAYRHIIMPRLPDEYKGWRLTKSNWTLDASGTQLAYQVEWKEYARNLPQPAFSGKGNFVWTRKLGGASILGIKQFRAELMGNANSSTVDMLAQLVRVASNRFVWSGLGADLIIEMAVSENDFFNSKRIALSVTGQGTGNPVKVFSEVGGATGGINWSLLDDITTLTNETVEGEPLPDGPYYKAPSVYGASFIRSVRKELFKAEKSYEEPEPTGQFEDGQFPIARVESADQVTETETQVLQDTSDSIFDAGGQAVIDAVIGTPPGRTWTDGGAGSDPFNEGVTNHMQYPYITVRLREDLHVVDTGMRVLHTQSNSAEDIAFQVKKPTVIVHTTMDMVRRGRTPDPQMLDMPPGAVLLGQRLVGLGGYLDSNNEYVFSAKYERWVQIAYTSGNAPVLWTLGLSGIRQFSVSENFVRIPTDPRTGMPFNVNLFELLLEGGLDADQSNYHAPNYNYIT